MLSATNMSAHHVNITCVPFYFTSLPDNPTDLRLWWTAGPMDGAIHAVFGRDFRTCFQIHKITMPS